MAEVTTNKQLKFKWKATAATATEIASTANSGDIIFDGASKKFYARGIEFDCNNTTYSTSNFASASHTHTSAAFNSSVTVGSSYQPVYINAGTVTACTSYENAVVGSATKLRYINVSSVNSALNTTADDAPCVMFYASISKSNTFNTSLWGSTALAGPSDTYGFPVTTNANAILWIGAQKTTAQGQPYGGQLGISSDERLYYRYCGASVSTTTYGGSWKRIAWTSDIPATPTLSSLGGITSSEVDTKISTALTSVLTYKGTIGSGSVTSLPANHKQGDVYVVNASGKTYAGKTVEIGDYIICNTTGTTANNAHWDVINGENQVSNKDATLAWATATTIATVDGTDINVTLPACPTSVSYADSAGSASYADSAGSLTIGSTANKPLITTTNGVVTTGSFGTTANTFCQGNDSRLSDSRTPTAHAVNTTTYGAATTSLYGHVKLATGDMNGASNENGVAVSKAHTHSQYLTSISTATSGAVGGMKVGSVNTSTINALTTPSSPTTGRYYAVEVDSGGKGYVYVPWTDNNDDTKNTAGSSNNTQKHFLIGATSQSTFAQTFSDINCYSQDGHLYSNSKQVATKDDLYWEDI